MKSLWLQLSLLSLIAALQPKTPHDLGEADISEACRIRGLRYSMLSHMIVGKLVRHIHSSHTAQRH